MSDMSAYRDVFLAESGEYIQQITDGLLALEKDTTDTAPVEVVFRGAHSLKGMAAAMGYDRTADLTHKMESLMDKVRRDEIPITTELIDVVLAAVDLVRDLIDDEANGRKDIDPAEMAALLLDAAEGRLVPSADDPGYEDDEAEAAAAQDEDEGNLLREAFDAGESVWSVTVTLDPECVLKAVRSYMVIKRFSHMGRVLFTVPSSRDLEDEKFDRTFSVTLAAATSAEAIREAGLFVSEIAEVSVEPVAVPALAAGKEQPSSAPARNQRKLPRLSEAQTVRVAIGHLDMLVNLVGELVILRSRLERLASAHGDMELTETVNELQRISADLQYEVLQTRMVPVGNIFNRFPRMVRDLAADLGKQVDFEVDGLDIELDRTVLDEIGDPIVHLLRNSLDHGVEEVTDRVAAGKPAEGRIRLTASRERDHVAIVVSDDGSGIDPEKLWSAAVAKGMVTSESRAEYSTADVLQLICTPGFSTAEKATKVSGRGVGMDVVKGKIEHLGGTLQIYSVPGKGTDFILRLPLTLAIVRALLVRAVGQTFALPLSSVTEVLAVEELQVDTIEGAPVAVLRDGSVVPLLRLDSILMNVDSNEPMKPRSSVALIEVGDSVTALNVGEVVGRREIVVKPLSRLFRDTKGFSGATILGDGRVVLIIDPRTIFSAMEVVR